MSGDKPNSQVKLLLNFTDKESKAWKAEAEGLNMTLSAWIRLCCNAAIRERAEGNGKKRKARA